MPQPRKRHLGILGILPIICVLGFVAEISNNSPSDLVSAQDGNKKKSSQVGPEETRFTGKIHEVVLDVKEVK